MKKTNSKTPLSKKVQSFALTQTTESYKISIVASRKLSCTMDFVLSRHHSLDLKPLSAFEVKLCLKFLRMELHSLARQTLDYFQEIRSQNPKVTVELTLTSVFECKSTGKNSISLTNYVSLNENSLEKLLNAELIPAFFVKDWAFQRIQVAIDLKNPDNLDRVYETLDAYQEVLTLAGSKDVIFSHVFRVKSKKQ